MISALGWAVMRGILMFQYLWGAKSHDCVCKPQLLKESQNGELNLHCPLISVVPYCVFVLLPRGLETDFIHILVVHSLYMLDIFFIACHLSACSKFWCSTSSSSETAGKRDKPIEARFPWGHYWDHCGCVGCSESIYKSCWRPRLLPSNHLHSTQISSSENQAFILSSKLVITGPLPIIHCLCQLPRDDGYKDSHTLDHGLLTEQWLLLHWQPQRAGATVQVICFASSLCTLVWDLCECMRLL